MNRDNANKTDKRQSIWWQRFIRTSIQRIVNTIVLLMLTVAMGLVLYKTEGYECGPLKWCAAASYYLALLMLVGWFFSIFSLILRKSIVGVMCFAALFVWGSSAYFIWHVDDDMPGQASLQIDAEADVFFQQQLEAPNRAISAFFPSRGGFEHIDRQHRGHYFLFHLLVIAFVAAVMFSHFGRGLVNRFKKRFVIREGKLNVFWGLGDVGQMLARNIIETTTDQEVVFLLPNELRFNGEKLKEAVWQLDSFDAVWVLADLTHPSRSNVRGHRHFFLNDSGHQNVSHANQFVKTMAKYGIKKPDDVFLYVRIEADENERIFFKWAESVKEFVTPIIVRESDMIARCFIEAHPMLDCPGVEINPERAMVSGSCRVLMVGFGTTGQSVLREMVSNGQFKGMSRFSVDIIEGDSTVVEAYKTQHEEALQKYNIRFVRDMMVPSLGFDEFIKKNIHSYNRIVVCLSDDVMNIRVASSIEHIFNLSGIGVNPNDVLFVRVSDPNRCSYFTPQNGMTLFGDLREAYSRATLDFDPIDMMAKILHGEWEKDKSEQNLRRVWNHATFNDQRSSRASALGEKNLARIVGFEVVPMSDSRQEVAKEEFDSVLAGKGETISREAILAENEHLRWNAYHRMLGYSCWDMKNPPLEHMAEKKANQLATLGKHACLVDFAELPSVDYEIACAIEPECKERLKPADFVGNVKVLVNGKQKASLQAYDYMFVKKIWDNVAAVGMKLVRANAERKNEL